ncbi:MAG: hypothetical protein WD845_07420 [Pirellulales bacterium]
MRFGTIVLVVALLLSTLCRNVDAWQLTITGQHHIWNSVDPSATHVVGIENPGASTDPLFAWSLGLEIVPDASATGTLEFASATVPNEYLLAGRSGGLIPPFAGPSTSIAPIGDSDALFTGILVPGTGKSLLASTFVASPDAQGLFRIFAVGDPFTGSNWFSSDFQNTRSFANAPFTGGPVEIGSITIVPEPSSLLLGGQLIVATMLLAWRAGLARGATRT